MTKQKKDILLLVDGNALVHRGFHAIPHLSNQKGEPTNGVYGFAMLLLKAIKDLQPKYVAAAFDLPGGTFRDKLYEPYKAKRAKAPDELYAQIPKTKELVKAFSFPVYEKEGFEADDLIGSLAEQAKQESEIEVVILTGDMDALQLVDDQVKVYAPKQGLRETMLYDRTAVEKRYGLKPEQLVDYKALRGDPSDNIPGVRGIGEKTAVLLLQDFETLDNIYKNLDSEKIKPRVAELLKTYRADADLSRKLGRIVRDIKLQLVLANAELTKYNEKAVVAFFQEQGFKSLLDRLPKGNGNHKHQEFSIPEIHTPQKAHYHLVDSAEKYQAFFFLLKKQLEIAIDTETTSEHPMEARVLGLGFCWKDGEAYYLLPEFLTLDVKKVLEDSQVKKIGHNIKYDFLILKQAGVELQGLSFDTMIAAYLLNPGARNLSLDSQSFIEFGFRKTSITALIGEGRNQINMAEVSVAQVAQYCGEDADYTWRLKAKLSKDLRQKHLDQIFEVIEMPLVSVLAEMEYWGIKVDPQVLQKLSDEASRELEILESQIYKLAGEKFNIASPLQLKEILFEKLEIPNDELKKGKTGLSTAASELEKLRGLHPIIDLLTDWRELSKLLNTYLDALPLLINSKTERVHTSFNQTIAATGRLSSSDPNLQNIPIRTAVGRKVRSAFVAAPHFKLVAVDYSQIELRLAAHLSGDRKMLEVFRTGGDIHTATAQEIFDIADPSLVTQDQRRSAKTINFGVLYGLSAYGLTSRIPGVSRGEAQDFIDKYFETYSGLTKYLEEIISETKRSGLVKNEIGRVRYLPEIKSSQFQVRSGAERAAINMPFQSLSADIIKMAMNKLREAELTNREDCRLLLQVHDELVFEISEKQVDTYIPQIIKIMTEIYKLKVPLVVEVKAGENWEEMKKLEGEFSRGNY